LAYGNFDGSEVSKPPGGTFILPESALIVNFIASLYPDIDYKDPVTRAKANLLAFQFENVTLPPFLQLAESSTGDDKSIQAFLSTVKALNPYLDDEVVNTTEYGLGDILIAPLLNCIFLFSRHEAGSFEEGTGQKMLDLLQSEPEYSKFLKYWEKLKAWDARKSTADDDVLLAGWKAKGAKKHG
jgi:glutathione S-transferase